LKVPAEMQRWMERLDTPFFVTTWSGSDFQVYTRDGFVSQIEFLEEVTLDPELRESASRAIFNGRKFGGDVAMDSDGRLLLPPLLRQKLSIDKQTAAFYMGVDFDHFTAMPSDAFLNRSESYEPFMASDAELLRSVGLR
jgi:DNA-binding transcriptional regulator/RsmH inhibitor MraZ